MLGAKICQRQRGSKSLVTEQSSHYAFLIFPSEPPIGNVYCTVVFLDQKCAPANCKISVTLITNPTRFFFKEPLQNNLNI